MAKPLLPDDLWDIIEPLLPPLEDHPDGGHPWVVSNRQALTGILFVLKTGIPWEDLPCEMNCGSGMTCWRRLKDWQEAGVWDRVQEVLLARLRAADRLDFSRFVVDSSHVRAVGGGEQTGPSPVDRSKRGSKHHVITDAQGVPLATHVTGANAPDEAVPLVDAVPPVGGKPGRPRQRPERVMGDRGYDSEAEREQLRARGIDPELAKRRTPHGSGLGVFRWVVERTLSWFHQFRRLRIRYDRQEAMHQGFLKLAEVLITYRFLVTYGLC
jgi:transposase